jgi:hypothetical protein
MVKMKFKMYCKYKCMQIYSKLSWFKKVEYATGQFIWVESKQLCRDISTLLEIVEKYNWQHETQRDVT